ncbi:methyltransferase type 11 [Rhodococcus aetherivorans]|uniref:Methyltransferase type 11 n=1 Tax=Rhodococcus aetherivorans TaxID=191292 RepID=A0ABQ0YE23_9NOCA|nr:class I SAM-dependent methyltransferase [Rhodococcus aetherivorans]ETT26103.1 Methyltransferase type 11 [Rhodococcus rhodochrous ATCC 21198]KDE11535.1 SAM-dependent methlyltransferase [Rhodococcus aetherivorans]NGP29701.1 class I SAM-dependent methyltransferase [Rhodococcus aetherivorans]GES34770.1 methyltransferase type 11 [Rhodococcus aetherivorans]
MPMAPFDPITAVYTPAHAWMYEAIVAPAVYPSRHVIDEHFLPHLPQNAHILDVGSGGALFTNYIADQRSDLHIIGLDLSRPQIKRATKRMRRYGERVRFQVGDATRLDFADQTFDGVISYGSIKHWSSREAGLAECMRVLKPAGPLLITDADRSTSFDDAKKFIENYKMPRFLRGINLAIFHTWIAGRSIGLEDARDLANRLDLVDENVARITGMPLVMISGRKAGRPTSEP